MNDPSSSVARKYKTDKRSQRTRGGGLGEAVKHMVLPLARGRLVVAVARPRGDERCV